ncbi:hypothetical protein DH2020_044678 [Rehmannia glutinosa]|uniref:Large ribosomal subunit protein bL12 C-terminal domain-containing protein n=1 Tax=Rehmannia glutinosa TaxID=99300 RepID=A0ABR0UGA1_REHGL
MSSLISKIPSRSLTRTLLSGPCPTKWASIVTVLRPHPPAIRFIGIWAGASSAPRRQKKTAFDVKLEKFDPTSKLKVIKEIRAFTDLGLKEAKDLVEKTPRGEEGVTKEEEAEKILEKLKEVGATVVLE